MIPRGKSKTGRVTITKAKNATKIMQMRIKGLTHRQIGEELGVSEQRVWRICSDEMDRLNRIRAETVEQHQRIELERLDGMLAGVWSKAQAGELGAISAVLNIMNRRAKLLGLDLADKNAATQAGPLVLTFNEVVINSREAIDVVNEEPRRVDCKKDERGQVAPGATPVPEV